jgi:hypothetical protein
MKPIRITTLLAFLFVVVVGSGLYTILPASFQLLCGVSLMALPLDRSWRRAPLAHLPPAKIGGIALLSGLYMLNVLSGRMEWMDLISALYALAGFSFAHTLASLHEDSAGEAGPTRSTLWAIATLLVLLGGQIAQLTGFLTLENAGTGEEIDRLVLRPGGFHNPNMASALALLLVEIILVGTAQKFAWLRLPGFLAMTTTIVMAQSRASTLFLGLRALLGLIRRGISARSLSLLLLGGVATFIGLATLAASGSPLLEAFTGRFSGDDSSDERGRLLGMGLDAFGRAPWFGHGHHHLMQMVGLSAHNEIVENLVNWGVVGSIPVWMAFLLLYAPRNRALWLTGIAPSLLFSHNFFATISLQVLLGTAMGIEHARMRTPGRAPGQVM